MKISIPKAEIDRIMEDYNCTQEEATQAYIAAASSANDVFQSVISERLESSEKKYNLPLYTPREIKAHLDKYVIGQEEYKKRISIAAAYHFAMVRYLRLHKDQHAVKRFRKKNTLISGPSGSGKTYCIEVLGDFLKVPALIVDATDYTEMGYVGKSADDMVRELIDMAPGSNHKEQAEFINQNGGIIFIDELDKKAKGSSEEGRFSHDVSNEGFQRSVLKLLERKSVSVENPYSPVSQIQEAMDMQHGNQGKKDKMVSTENILFILGGSFERTSNGLEAIVKKRIMQNIPEDADEIEYHTLRGFSTPKDNAPEQGYHNYFKDAGVNDYIHFGLLPELIGRTPIRTFVNLLSKNDLVRIMMDTEDSIISQYKVEFEQFNIDLEFTPEAIDYIADQASSKRTGARALVSVLETILTEFQYELPGTNFTTLLVDKKLCEKPSDILLQFMERSPFVDYVESFKREYGLELVLNEEVQQYILDYAKENNLEVSQSIKKLLQGAISLNFMNIKGKFEITLEMIQDPKYFDNLYLEWYQSQKAK